ncbi:hypothetical protein GS636_10650 [Ruegeria sp. HKCCD4884]|nr:hypothetical protein [Ruegeria sp. HKCCD4884]
MLEHDKTFEKYDFSTKPSAVVSAAECAHASPSSAPVTISKKPPQALSSPLLSVLFAERKAEAEQTGQWSAKLLNDYQAWIDLFIELQGDRPVLDYRKTDARDFKNVLIELPSNRNKLPQTIGLTPREAVQAAKDHGLPTLSVSTVNKALGRLQGIPELESVGIQLLLLLHLLCVAFWVGIFSPLRSLALMPEHLTDAAELGHRFGQAAALIVPTLIVAGLWMAWLLVGNLQGLLFTGYGQALLFKVLLVGLLLTLAAANKLRFVPSMQSGDAKAARHLARSIEGEAIVVLVVLATTATLTSVLTLPS